MQLYLSITPKDTPNVRGLPISLAHVAYRVSPQGLLQQSLLASTRGGLMSLSDVGCPVLKNAVVSIRQILRECAVRSFSGVLADFEEQTDQTEFLSALAAALRKSGGRLYVPERYAHLAPNAVVILSTALSGGDLKERLSEAREQYGEHGFALDFERLSMDFTLPSPTGEGSPLTREQLRSLFEERQPAAFYSTELCARYFTYSKDSEHHFVLYDDADTLRKKIRLGESMGAAAGFFMYPEVDDLLPALFRS